MNLEQWLTHCESLHAKNIDMGLARVRLVAQQLELKFNCPVFTVAGTNGKGSTCAMLESILEESGYKTGVYTSPHLFDFRERCRIGRVIASEEQFVRHFERVEIARGEISLTYFEFTTLVILDLMASSELDVAILEVGLGGRLDAVNIIVTDCAIITSIDIDHTEYLGNDRETIAREKAGIMRAGRPVIISDPVPPNSLLESAQKVGADPWFIGRDFNFMGDKQQWSFVAKGKRRAGLAYPALRGANQLFNACAVLAALESMRDRLAVTAQGIRNGFSLVSLPGRFQIFAGQPTLILDVAHNPHAVSALFENLDAMGFFPCTHAVFGAMADKDIEAILKKMAPIVTHWYFCDLPTDRAIKALDLQNMWLKCSSSTEKSNSSISAAVKTQTFPGPVQALNDAIANANPADRIVVFGSFYTVGGVLEHGIPRLSAPHLQSPASPPTIQVGLQGLG
jgi:dihydrofolate synthase/folylpolyglutamate synthase